VEVVMAYLLREEGSGLLVLRGKEYDHGHLPPSLVRAVEVVMAYLLKKRRSALPSP
jgi:hypothetical protein